ncbi:hypothetical protein ONE63_010233 [Megalurothrips usitatus]|uniref:Carboxylesterase type B domain-containing protein n=1 Tax=Megalurothrips usitatus TaxID=439358 RepID=A0AAV7XLC4_9NEOP|nr:hypothetical protein ONE63_010233 [Megalurothrips usitatus]
MGPAHGEELPYVFGAPLAATVRAFPSNYSKAEVALSEAVMTYWTNFARTGNPNQASAAQQEGKDRSKQRGAVGWEEYDAGHQKYLEIGLKPRMKNHFRAHKMSIWLRLVPELHRAGQEDVVARHNLFRNHNESSLYDGVVRPDPLGRAYGFGPLAGLDGVDDTGMLGGRHGNATPRLSDVFLPVTMPTCLNITGSYHTFGNGSAAGVGGGGGGGHGGAIGGGGDMMEPEGLAAYSTALGVTLAIGCSLLVLNVLIFAGVFYQRDRTRLQVKSLKQQQRIRGACEDLAGGGSSAEKAEKQFPHLRHSFSSSVIVDMEREKTACGAQQGQQVLHCEKSPVSSMKSSKSGGGLATGLAVYTGQPPNYSSYLHQVADYPGGPMGGPGPAGGDDGAMVLRHSFHAANTFRDGPSRASAAVATLPRNMGVMNAGCKEGVTLGPAAMTSMGTSMGHSMTPNGCAGAPMHHTLPRPPPPPRVNSRASDGGDPQRDLRLPQAALSEMRV